jgi:glycosyltransferase involved in cell wall biosynthesis
MKVLSVVRLFSGLANTLDSGEWRPQGVPAIARMLETLAADPRFTPYTVFTVHDREVARRFPRWRRFQLPPLGTVEILPYRRLPGAPRRLELALTRLEQTVRCCWLYLRLRPEVSYFTNANFAIAGIFARLGLGRVVLRLMGLVPYHRTLATGGGPAHWLLRRLMASPFDHVVCTQEGSGVERVLPALLRPGVPRSILLNGVDSDARDPERVRALRRELGLGRRPVVLFVGRLEPYKGCRPFVEACIAALRRRTDCLDALVVGYGSLTDELVVAIDEAGLAQRIRLVGGVDHDDVANWYALADIYVSLNMYGNLSNANLEALRAGCCMILPDADPESGIDEATNALIPPNVAPRLPRAEVVDALADTLLDLIDDPERIEIYRRRAANVAARALMTWPERIEEDLAILLGSGNRPAADRGDIAGHHLTGQTQKQDKPPACT